MAIRTAEGLADPPPLPKVESPKLAPAYVGQTQRSPLPALPASSTVMSSTPKIADQVIIEFSVLETEPSLAVTLDAMTIGESLESQGNVGFMLSKSRDAFVRSLVESKAATVLSRPQVVTLNGQAAQVQVGQEVTISLPGAPDETRTVGLKLSCRPVISNDKLTIEIDCENSKLSDEQRIDVSTLKTTVSMDWGKTVVLQGLGKHLLLLVTPKRVQNELAVDHGVFPSPAAARADETRIAAIKRIADIQKAFRVTGSADVKDISISGNRWSIEADLSDEDVSKIPLLLEEFGKSTHLQVDKVSTTATENGMKLVIHCKARSEKKASSSHPLESLELAVEKLFPNESIELAKLPNAVVLRGNVDANTARQVVDIAEQYYPTVINHLEGQGTEASRSSSRSDSLGQQLDGLTTEVKSLRAEVRRLIETMKSETKVNSTSSSSTSQFVPDSRKSWKLTLEELLSIAEQNNQFTSSVQRNQIRDSIARDFKKLEQLQLQAESLRANRAAGLDILKGYSFTGGADDDSFSVSIGTRHEHVAQRALQLEQRRVEASMRKLLGLAAQDGRRIEAVPEARTTY